MAVGKNTIPYSKRDKNGKMTTVYANPSKDTEGAKRAMPQPKTNLVPSISDPANGGQDRRIYSAEQRSEHFPRATHAALISHRAMRYSSDITATELKVYGTPVYVGEESHAVEVSKRLSKDGVDNVIVYDPHGGYQVAQRFTYGVDEQASPEAIANAYLWIEDEMETWGSRVNEEVLAHKRAVAARA